MILDLPEKTDRAYIKKLIDESEKAFEDQLEALAKKISESKDLKIISLCGPSCSGKTTTARKIIDAGKKAGFRVLTLSIDDFYKDRYVYEAECEHHGRETDFESVNAIDMNYLSICFERMMKGRECMLPVYDFMISERVRYIPYTMRENDVILLEGIQTMYPTTRQLIDKAKPLYVFIDAAEGLMTPHGNFGTRDLRLARRLVRDYYKRNSTAESTFRLWRQVVANEDSAIYPYKGLADYTINSTMAYEPLMFRRHLIKILGSVSRNSEFYMRAKELISLYAPFPDADESLLPENSVFHEFL